MKKISFCHARGWFTGLFLTVATAGAQQHIHINAGAFSPVQNSQLYFANGGTYVTNSGYVVHLTPTNAGPFANTHQGSLSFAALPATPDLGGPAFGHAALGAQLDLQVVSVAGPVNSQFSLWEVDENSGVATVRFTVPVGTTNSANHFLLSENNGEPGADPYGHIHGRYFTTTKAGLHTVGFRLRDLSANGAGGGPIHPRSDIFYLHFQADTTIAALRRTSNTNTATFGTRSGSSYYLETTPALGVSNSWTTAAGPLAGNNRLQSLVHPAAAGTNHFYRLRVTTP